MTGRVLLNQYPPKNPGLQPTWKRRWGWWPKSNGKPGSKPSSNKRRPCHELGKSYVIKKRGGGGESNFCGGEVKTAITGNRYSDIDGTVQFETELHKVGHTPGEGVPKQWDRRFSLISRMFQQSNGGAGGRGGRRQEKCHSKDKGG